MKGENDFAPRLRPRHEYFTHAKSAKVGKEYRGGIF